MATQEQLDTVRKLHEVNDRTLGGYKDGQYNIAQTMTKTKTDAGTDTFAFGDPYERYYAEKAGGTLTVDATVLSVTFVSFNSAPTVGEVQAGEAYLGEVTYTGGNPTPPIDNSVTYSLTNIGPNTGTYLIGSESGILISDGSANATDNFDIVATSTFDGTTVATQTVIIAS